MAETSMGTDAFLILIGLLVSNGFRHLLSALLKMRNPACGFTRDFSYEPAVSILLPCFNEGRAVYEAIGSICRSDYPKEKFEIVAIDDCSSDDSYDWILKAQADFAGIRMRSPRNAQNCGKAESQSHALNLSTGDVILCLDRDAIHGMALPRRQMESAIEAQERMEVARASAPSPLRLTTVTSSQGMELGSGEGELATAFPVTRLPSLASHVSPAKCLPNSLPFRSKSCASGAFSVQANCPPSDLQV